ncbi:MAG: RecQ family ATP-dependent DNA helicase [Sediminicola sp.]
MPKDPHKILSKYWGFSNFRGSQQKIVASVLSGQDVLALLPTGGGKSVCYQVPALASEGICIVVSPLIALINNQVDTLKKQGIKAIALTGGIPYSEVMDLLDNCLYGNYKFLYLSPERLQQDLVQERIRQMQVSLIAIDEAHCISQWGHDFRPAYRNCALLRELLPQSPMIALTATATPKVARDIMENLGLLNPTVFKDSFARSNIAFNVVRHEDKRFLLKKYFHKLRKSAIVYVGSRRASKEISDFLNGMGHRADFFHGGIPKQNKKKKMDLWLNDTVPTMVATNAFGMGIDKPDVELVVHYHIPSSLENYYQEAGRAGRNGQAAKAVLITNPADAVQLKKQFLGVLPDVPFLKLLYLKLNNYFQVAYGEAPEEIFQLHFNKFCDAYQLNPILAYNGLRVLDQNSVISLSESFARKLTVQFTAQKAEIFSYLDRHLPMAPIIKTILRTYGGIFEHPVTVNPHLIAKKANVAEQQVLVVLERLQTDGIILMNAQESDLELIFLVPREDGRTINLFADKVREQQQMKIDNIERMLAYINNDAVCRNQQLLAYFGEEGDQCGQCDVCLKKRGVDRDVLQLVKQEILALLDRGPKSSRAMILSLPYREETVLMVLQQLLEEDKITLTNRNKYKKN